MRFVTTRSGLKEIIETYWNVNELKAAREEAAVARNNRNILECK